MSLVTTFLSHSRIESYPPNIYEYPNFYKCKEHVFTLYPGDVLYIPPKWFHWIFSYNNTDNTNKAISFPILNQNILSKTSNPDILSKKPFIYHVNINTINFDILNNEYVGIFKSKNHNIYPFNKTLKTDISKSNIIYSNINDLINKKKHNFVCNAHMNLNFIKPPEFLNYILDKNKEQLQYKSLLFNTYSRNDTPINTGLHYDYWHNFLVQIDGIKVVRLYHPNCHKNLYVHPVVFL